MKSYPEYKKVDLPWLEEVPRHWEFLKAKTIFQSPKILNISNSEKDVLSLTLNGCLDNDKNKPIGLSPQNYSTYQLFDQDNLVFKLIDLNNIKTSRVGLVHKRGIMSSSYIRFVLEEGDSKYFYYLYYSWYLKQVYNKLGEGVRSTLSSEDLLKISIPIPPLPEQRAIVSFLEGKEAKIKKYLTEKKRMVELLKEKRQGIINQAVTQGISPPGGIKGVFKDSGIDWLGKIPAHWEVRKLKYVSYLNPSKNEIGDIDKKSKVVFLPMEKVSSQGQCDNSLKLSIDQLNYGLTYFRKGDVLLAKITPCFENGKGSYLFDLETKFGFGSTEFIVLRPKERINGFYLDYLLRTSRFRKEGKDSMKGSAGQQRISPEWVKNYDFSLPPLPEQKAIVAHIEKETAKIDQLIAVTEKQIKLMEEYRIRTISDLVTGKCDVRDNIL